MILEYYSFLNFANEGFNPLQLPLIRGRAKNFPSDKGGLRGVLFFIDII
jgi:hypothetical protein